MITANDTKSFENANVKTLEIAKDRVITESAKEHFETLVDEDLEKMKGDMTSSTYFIYKHIIDPIRVLVVKDESLAPLGNTTECFLIPVWFLV
jgi:hypothetical protein